MKLFSDACIYRITERAVISWGHDLEIAHNVGLAEASNDDIPGYAISKGPVLLTRDMHFSNILLYPPESHIGIIVLKIHPNYTDEVHALLKGFLTITSQVEMKNTLVIIDRNKWRLRRA